MKQKKNNSKCFVTIFTVVVSLYSIYNIGITQLEIKSRKHQLDIIKQKCKKLADYNKEYERIIAAESDQQYIRRISKEKFGLVGPDDRIFIDISSK